MPNQSVVVSRIAVILVIAFATAHAQVPSTQPRSFDAISIKPDKAGSAIVGQAPNGEAIITSRTMIHTPPDGFSATNMNAKLLIANAYGIKDNLITGGPDWLGTTGYDIEAKVTSFDSLDVHQLTKDQRNQMLQVLLADRFHLIFHNETKEAIVYELTLAKGGSKLKQSMPAGTQQQSSPAATVTGSGTPSAPMIRMAPGQLSAQGMFTAQLVDILSRQLQRNVVDKTGLAGKYDVTLQYTPDTSSGSSDSSDATGPSIFNALREQLGLKLDSAKGSVQSFVIDHIDKPSEN